MKLEEFISYEQPTNYIVHSDQYTEDGRTPVLTAGQSFILGYTDEEDGIYDGEPVVIFDDFTTSVQYVDFPFKVKSSAMKILKNKENANIKFCYYLLSWFQEMPPNHKRQWISTTSQIDINLPSLTEQEAIVKKIEAVSNIIKHRNEELSELDNLIKARFVELFGDYHTNSKSFESHKGSELFKFSSGKFLPEEKRFEDGIPVYGGNGIAWYTDSALIDYPTIIIGRVGAWCGNIHTVSEPVWITDNAIYIKEQYTDKFTLEFLTEMMKIMDFHQYADFSGQPKITQKPLETLEYLTPPIDMQNEFTEFCKQVDKSKFDNQIYYYKCS